jgi:hypothetical protein
MAMEHTRTQEATADTVDGVMVPTMAQGGQVAGTEPALTLTWPERTGSAYG